MRSHPKHFVLVLVALLSVHWSAGSASARARVSKEGGKIYIVDQTDELWDITQAFAGGYDPDHFEFVGTGDGHDFLRFFRKSY